MSADNPYDFQSPSAEAAQGSARLSGIIEELRMTRPWVRLIGILGMLGVVLMCIGGAFLVVGGLAAAGQGGGAAGIASLTGIGLMYFVFAFLYAYPCWKLMKYGTAISNLESSGRLEDVEVALAEQRGFWRFLGILTAIVLILYLMVLGGSLMFGLFAA